MHKNTDENSDQAAVNDFLGLTFCLLVKDEKANLCELVPQLVRLGAEVLVADTGSIDGTIEAAGQFGAQVVKISWQGNFSDARNTLLKSVNTTWVFMIDADERLTPELESEIQKILKNPSSYTGFCVPRKNHYLGKWLKHGGQYPDFQLKMFRRGKARFDRNVHEKTIIIGQTGYLKGHVLHYSYNSVGQYLKKFNLYTELESDILLQSRIRPNAFRAVQWLIIKPCIRFFKRYFLKLGFLDGIPGLFAATFDVLGYVVRFYKLWEKVHGERGRGTKAQSDKVA